MRSHAAPLQGLVLHEDQQGNDDPGHDEDDGADNGTEGSRDFFIMVTSPERVLEQSDLPGYS